MLHNKIKPMLANDADLDTIIYPCITQPKIDGVRALNLAGNRITGRSLDEFKCPYISDYFSKYAYLDGELTLGDSPTAPNLCSLTTGAVNKFIGVTKMPNLHWWVFDLLTPGTLHQDYQERLANLRYHWTYNINDPRIHLVPSTTVKNRAQLDAVIDKNFAEGYEGTIIRNPRSPYKEGRPSKKTQSLVRVKPWSDFEILITGITEGRHNNNAATTNSLGRTERSSHQENQTPNGQVGSIQGTLLEDFYNGSTLLFKKGLNITASSGTMTVAEATDYFNNPHKLIGEIAKIKTLTTGTKDLPRFPVFLSLRSKQDIS